jgi:hypothetical protein
MYSANGFSISKRSAELTRDHLVRMRNCRPAHRSGRQDSPAHPFKKAPATLFAIDSIRPGSTSPRRAGPSRLIPRRIAPQPLFYKALSADDRIAEGMLMPFMPHAVRALSDRCAPLPANARHRYPLDEKLCARLER